MNKANLIRKTKSIHLTQSVDIFMLKRIIYYKLITTLRRRVIYNESIAS